MSLQRDVLNSQLPVSRNNKVESERLNYAPRDICAEDSTLVDASVRSCKLALRTHFVGPRRPHHRGRMNSRMAYLAIFVLLAGRAQ